MIVWRSICYRCLVPLRQLPPRRQINQASLSSQRMRVVDLLETTPSEDESLDVTVAGFVRSIRKQKQVAFASLDDGSSINSLQAVMSPDQAKSLSNGSAVVIQGKWTRSSGGKGQAQELVADHVEVQGDNDVSTYPIQKKYLTPDFLRGLPHLRARTPYNALLLRLRSQIITNVTNFFAERDYVQTHPPIITSSDCEGAGEVFTVDSNHSDRQTVGTQDTPPQAPFFGSRKYLTVSTQLHLEALAQSVGKVWTLSPAFRAEHSDTSRHLSEFYMLEAELAFATELSEIMDVVEELIRHLAMRLRQSKIGEELLQDQQTSVTINGDGNLNRSVSLSRRWDRMIESPWPRVTYHEICLQLQKAVSEQRVAFDVPPNTTAGLQTEHERFIAGELFGRPVFVTDYPRSMKPFYMAPSSNALEGAVSPTVSCFDLLMPEVCEVVGGSMREHRLGPLKQAMRQQQILGESGGTEEVQENGSLNRTDGRMNKRNSDLDWYLDLRRYGSVPHGGFGLGFDRLLGAFAGVTNIRDIVTFPRHFKRCLT